MDKGMLDVISMGFIGFQEEVLATTTRANEHQKGVMRSVLSKCKHNGENPDDMQDMTEEELRCFTAANDCYSMIVAEALGIVGI